MCLRALIFMNMNIAYDIFTNMLTSMHHAKNGMLYCCHMMQICAYLINQVISEIICV